jgi:hypothetical protein
VLLATVYKSPGHAWNDADIIELFSFRHKPLPAGYLNAKHPFWNTIVSKPSGVKLLNLLHINEFEISAPQCPTHYSSVGNGDVLSIVVHKNVWLSEVIVADILDSDHLPIIFHLLDQAGTRNLSQPADKFTDWECFQSLALELISPRIQTNSGKEDDKATSDFTASTASAYRLWINKITLSDLNNDLPVLKSLLKHKQIIRKLWQVTQDPVRKMAVNSVTKIIRWMTHNMALEWWETKVENCEVTI